LDVQWPCQSVGPDSGEIRPIWFRADVVDVQDGHHPRFLLRFEDGEECWNTLRKLTWRRRIADAANVLHSQSGGVGAGAVVGFESVGEEPEVPDATGFVHRFELDAELLEFCDWLFKSRDAYGDKTRGEATYGESVTGGLVSVLIRREALPPLERDLYNRLHKRCMEEVPLAWPDWLRKLGGRDARARPSQDLRLLQYTQGANLPEHVDSGWACQALVYLNDDFRGGHTAFPNIHATYRPRRGSVLMWRNICVCHKPSVPGSMADHPALHVARPVVDGTKRALSLHLVVT